MMDKTALQNPFHIGAGSDFYKILPCVCICGDLPVCISSALHVRRCNFVNRLLSFIIFIPQYLCKFYSLCLAHVPIIIFCNFENSSRPVKWLYVPRMCSVTNRYITDVHVHSQKTITYVCPCTRDYLLVS